jgi:hypothetical protein
LQLTFERNVVAYVCRDSHRRIGIVFTHIDGLLATAPCCPHGTPDRLPAKRGAETPETHFWGPIAVRKYSWKGCENQPIRLRKMRKMRKFRELTAE